MVNRWRRPAGRRLRGESTAQSAVDCEKRQRPGRETYFLLLSVHAASATLVQSVENRQRVGQCAVPFSVWFIIGICEELAAGSARPAKTQAYRSWRLGVLTALKILGRVRVCLTPKMSHSFI